MGFQRLLAQLRAEFDAMRVNAHFEIGRTHERALAPYESSRDILVALQSKDTADYVALQSRDTADYAARNELVGALVRMHQRKQTSHWASVLTLAFAPMLLALRCGIRGDTPDASDLDQLVIEGFLLAIARQPTAVNHIPARLRRATRAFVFQRIKAERERRVRQSRLERTVTGDELFLDWIPKVLHEADADESAELLRCLAGPALPQRKRDMLVATRLRGVSLRSYIRAGHVPWDVASESFETVLQRTKRERSRTLRQLRPIIEAQLALQSELRVASEVDLARAS